MISISYQLTVIDETIFLNVFLKDTSDPIVIFIPEAGGRYIGEYISVYQDLIDEFINFNFNVVIFSPRGQKPSTGHYTFKNTFQDIINILDFLPSIGLTSSCIGLFGRSAGSIISMFTQSQDNRIKSVAVWGTPTNLIERHYKYLETRIPMFEKLRRSGTNINDEMFLNDLMNAEDTVKLISSPFMIGWGTLDLKYSNIEEQIDLFSSVINSPLKQLNIFENCDHFIHKNAHSFLTYSNLCVNWFKNTI
jgi:hypothetical protein